MVEARRGQRRAQRRQGVGRSRRACPDRVAAVPACPWQGRLPRQYRRSRVPGGRAGPDGPAAGLGNRRQIVLIVAAGIVAGLCFWVSYYGRASPEMTGDAASKSFRL